MTFSYFHTWQDKKDMSMVSNNILYIVTLCMPHILVTRTCHITVNSIYEFVSVQKVLTGRPTRYQSGPPSVPTFEILKLPLFRCQSTDSMFSSWGNDFWMAPKINREPSLIRVKVWPGVSLFLPAICQQIKKKSYFSA